MTLSIIVLPAATPKIDLLYNVLSLRNVRNGGIHRPNGAAA
jgi:hypothetical protein